MAIDNIKIAEQLRSLQKEIATIVEQQNKSLQSQLEITQRLAASMAEVANGSGDSVEKVQKLHEALEKAAKESDKVGSRGTTQKFAEALKKSDKASLSLWGNLKKVVKESKSFQVFAGFWTGFTAGIMGTVQGLSALTSGLTSIIGSLGQVAMAIITMPFKLLDSLINMSSQGGGSELRQNLENIRKEFGDLHKTAGAAIISVARGMKGELANTGLSVWRIMGRLADRLKYVAEFAKNMGIAFDRVSQQFRENGEVITAYIKGLHLLEGGQHALATISNNTGTSMAELGRQIANYSVQLGDEFHISAAQISSDVGEMMNDFEHFGNMAPQVLAEMSTFTRRLGVDLKGVLGIVEQFDNFEGAATSVAQLNQAFGMQLDALQLLKEQDPIARMEMQRKAFFATGRAVEQMTHQEQNLLASQTGLDNQAILSVFAQKNRSMSYDQVKKKSELAHKSQLTQAESLQKIAGAIERLVKSGSAGAGGFFERFVQGFDLGIRRSQAFRTLMINLRMALRETFRAGIQVGRAFVQFFPGIQQITKAIAGLFDRTRFRKMTLEVRTIFTNFFKSLTGNSGPASFSNLMENLKTMFWNYLDATSPQGRELLEGVKAFGRAAVNIISGMIGMISDGLVGGITYITDLLSGRKSLSGSMETAGGALGFIWNLIQPIIGALQKAWPPIVAALTRLWEEEVWPRVGSFLRENALLIGAVLFGPSIIGSIMSGVVAPLATSIAGAFSKAIFNAMTKVAADTAVKSVVTKTVSDITSSSAGGITRSVTSTEQISKAAGGAGAAASPMTAGRMLAIGGVMAIGIVAILAGMGAVIAAIRYWKITNTEMIQAGAVMGVAAGVMIELSLAVGILSVSGAMNAVPAGLLAGLAGLAGVAVIMGLTIAGIVYALKDYSTSQLKGASLAMAAGGAFMAVAAGVLTAATLVGALFVGTGGVAALAAAAGLAAIGATLGAMVEAVRQVIGAVSSIAIPPGFEQKFDVFSKALGAITTFGSMIAQISNSTSTASVWGIFTGSTRDNQIELLDSLSGFIENMGDQMVELVSSVLRQVSQIRTAPEDLKKAEIFGTIMTAVSAMLTSMQAPAALLSGGGLIGTIFGTNIAENLSNYSIFIENMGTSLGNLISVIMESIGPIINSGGSTFTDSSLKAFEVIGNILTVVGTMGRNLISIVNSQFAGLQGADLTSRAALVGEVVGTMMASIFSGGQTGGLITAISTLMTQLLGSMSHISAGDARKLTTFGPLLIAMFTAVGSVASAVGDISAMVSGLPPAAQGSALGTINSVIERLFTGISTISTTLLDTLRTTFAGITSAQLANMTSGITILKSMFEVITSIPPALKSLYDSLGSEGNIGQMDARLNSLISIFRTSEGGGRLTLLLQTMIETFNALPPSIGDPAPIIESLARSMIALDALKNINIQDIGGIIQHNMEEIQDGSFSSIAANIRTMIEEVNSISHELGALEPINITTSLKSLAGRLGLGDSETLTISNRNFNIDIKVKVNIGAEELEHVLTTRTGNTFVTGPARAGS